MGAQSSDEGNIRADSSEEGSIRADSSNEGSIRAQSSDEGNIGAQSSDEENLRTQSSSSSDEDQNMSSRLAVADLPSSQSTLDASSSSQSSQEEIPRRRRNNRQARGRRLPGSAAISRNNNNHGSSDSSSDTEPYDFNAIVSRVNHEQIEEGDNLDIIEINDTQPQNLNGANEEGNEASDDDDVILIPQVIETINLCTQVPIANIPINLHNQVIDITDSPTQPQLPRVVITAASTSDRENLNGGAVRSRIQNARNATPYQRNRAQPRAASTPNARHGQLNFSDSPNLSQTQKVDIRCPICLESVLSRTPQSTSCGHIFCKTCLVTGNLINCRVHLMIYNIICFLFFSFQRFKLFENVQYARRPSERMDFTIFSLHNEILFDRKKYNNNLTKRLI